MWPDNETATDLLRFDVHANLLRAVITDDSMLPLTIGVFGDWGGGKTSIMKMLETSLDPDTYGRGLCPALSMQLNRHCIREHVAVRGV